MADQDALYPLEFFVLGEPRTVQTKNPKSREGWKVAVEASARARARETDELGFLFRRPVAVTIYYFPKAPMQGDIDNIVKPILDALIHVAYQDDKDVERVTAQKFEPGVAWNFEKPSQRLETALAAAPPVVYVRVDDDLSWRRL